MKDRSPEIRGTSVIFLNRHRQILLLLRDNDPEIPFPNTWDLPGGHIEPNESPEACIKREMREEMDLDLHAFRLFGVFDMPDRTEYTFWQEADFEIRRIDLKEGQRINWFSESEALQVRLAYGFNTIVEQFFDQKPWRQL